MGEEPWRVHMVGTLAIDSLKQTKALSRAELEQRFGVDLDRPVVLCVQHPVTTEAELAASQERRTLSALATLGLQTVIVYPNADSGGRRMIDVIEQYRDRPNFHIFRSIPHVEFANLMRVASVLVGNSSAGIIEAPFYKLPVVNIGSRQLGRERAINVIDVRSNRREILAGLERALHDEGFRRSLHHLKNPYGSGDTSGKIVEVLRGTRLDRRLLEKRMTY